MTTPSAPPKRLTAALRAPTLGWLDLGSANTEAARRFMQSWNTEGSLDELGLGILRDAYADLFFPATNTIMTELRYMVFVPAVFCRMERGRVPADPQTRSRELQDKLRLSLIRGFDVPRGKGIIGLEKGIHLARFPSDVYWGALRTLGIYRHEQDSEPVSLDRLRLRSAEWKADEGQDVPDGGVLSAWDDRFPYAQDDKALFDAKGEWHARLTFDLTKAEAGYLANCYQGDAAVEPDHRKLLAGSLMAHLLKLEHKGKFALPWEVPAPESLTEHIRLARWLSALAAGAGLHYAYLLAKAAGKADAMETAQDRFRAWWSDGRAVVHAIDATEFVGNPFVRSQLKTQGRRKDGEFLTQWSAALSRHDDPDTFLADEPAARLIRDREEACKGRKSRLNHEKFRNAWSGGVPRPMQDTYLLDYRAGIGCKFLARLLA